MSAEPRPAAMRRVVGTYLAGSVAGAVLSLRRGRPARFAGVSLPGSPLVHALTIGTPLSAPPAMLGALAWAERRGDRQRCRLLALVFMVGVLGEVDTWRALRHPREHPATTALVVLDLALPMAMLMDE